MGKQQIDVLVQEKIMTPSEAFVSLLKKPGNLIVDDSTLDFLRSLRTNLPSRNGSVP